MKGVETNTDTQNSFIQIQLKKVDRSEWIMHLFQNVKNVNTLEGPTGRSQWRALDPTVQHEPIVFSHRSASWENWTELFNVAFSPTCSPGRNYYLNHDREKLIWWEEVGIAEGGKCPGRRWACEEAGKVSALLVTVLEDRVTSWFQEIELRHKCFLGGQRDGWAASSLSQLTG